MRSAAVKKPDLIRIILPFLLFTIVISLYCGPQSRKLSRLTGRPVNIKLPEDCVKVINISVANEAGGGNSVKNVTYINKEGHLITREYTDWGLQQGSVRWLRHDGSPYGRE